MPRLLVIGGSDAGISSSLRARELDPSFDVTMVVADRYPNFSICGIPYFISGETPDWRDLAHRTREEIDATGIELLLDTRATAIEPSERTVELMDARGTTEMVPYDRLVIGTGAVPIRPDIAGIELEGVHLLHTMDDTFALNDRLADAEAAVIVGGGYIGLEMADALSQREMAVTVLEQLPSVMTTVDPEMGELVGRELRTHGVEVRTSATVRRITQEGRALQVAGDGFDAVTADAVLIAVSVRPDTALAASAGAELGVRGAIVVDRGMRTGIANILAAGDCVETWHRMLQRPTYMPLGTTAHKQGRIAGENAVGGDRVFAGSLGTQVVKVFDLAVARTGLRTAEAAEAGHDPLTVETEGWDHKVYYPGATKMTVRTTGDRRDGRLLGAQIVGHRNGQVAKRIDIAAAALYSEMRVEELSDVDLSYTPPFSSPWDPLQVGAQAWAQAAASGSGSEVSTALR
ncbi:MAG TPA: FAD-dependent oxidoreductase [Actinomycetota bacterium]|nr:FAD-dependent oxidoreductase [Actinomycetota bacterium]